MHARSPCAQCRNRGPGCGAKLVRVGELVISELSKSAAKYMKRALEKPDGRSAARHGTAVGWGRAMGAAAGLEATSTDAQESIMYQHFN